MFEVSASKIIMLLRKSQELIKKMVTNLCIRTSAKLIKQSSITQTIKCWHLLGRLKKLKRATQLNNYKTFGKWKRRKMYTLFEYILPAKKNGNECTVPRPNQLLV